jgi:Bromodomain
MSTGNNASPLAADVPSSTTTNTTSTESNERQIEENLRNQLRAAMQNLRRREPLEPTYKRYLLNGIVSTKRPVLPKDKFYKRIGSDLRGRVESFMQQTRGKDPFDRISQRLPLQEEHMRAALTLREAKVHEQKALLEVTLSVVPRRFGMDAASRRRHLEGITVGLQSEAKPASRARTAPLPTTMAQQTEKARQQAKLEQQKAQAKAREEARQKREDAERKGREDDMHRKPRVETPQQALHKIYNPIFKKLWDMEFPLLGGINPFRIVIDRDNCAHCGAPDYFDVVEKPMNLTYIQQKVENMEYVSLQAFFQDVELMIANALLYNADTSNPYRVAAEEMKKRYCKIAKRVVQTIQQKQKAARP